VRTLSFLDSRIDNGLHPTLIRWGGNVLSLVRFRLFWRLCHFLARFFPGDDRRVLRLNSHTRLQIRLRDPYWSRLVCSRFTYEHDIEEAIRLVGDIPFVFIDCGANIGYWSAFLSQNQGGSRKAIAVEADHVMFEELCTNASLNGDRFSCLHRAIARTSRQRLCLRHAENFWDSGLHADTQVIAANEGDFQAADLWVESISLDDLAEQFLGLRQGPVVLKLDVEGMEIAALQGAAALLAAHPLLIYEDHGRFDREGSVGHYVFDKLGYNVFAWDDGSKRMLEMLTLEAIHQRKKRANVGYNFFACSSQSPFYQRFVDASRSFPWTVPAS
jgi:FkbM family methyltransferase